MINQGDIREKRICHLYNLTQNTTRNAPAVYNSDATGADGKTYEIKSWNGSFHQVVEIHDKDRHAINDEKFIQTLKTHKASHLIAVRKDSKGQEFTLTIAFADLIREFEQLKDLINFYSIQREASTKKLKFRPLFSKTLFDKLQSKGYKVEKITGE